MWQWQSTSTQWHVYVSDQHPAVHISVNVNDANDFHATNQHNQLHMSRDGTVSRVNAALRRSFEERYRLSLAIGSFSTQRMGGVTGDAVERGRVVQM